MRRRWTELLAVTGTLAVVVIAFWLVCFVARFDPKRSDFGTLDLSQYFYPKFVYGTAALVHGRLPLWNPHEHCGMPFVATGQVAALYPVKNLIFALLPPWLAVHVNAVFHFVLAGVLAFAYARWRGLGVRAASFAAALWALNPTFVMSEYHPQRSMVLSWLPLVLLLWERALAQRTLGAAALAGVGIAVEFSAGYPPYTFCIAVFLALLTLWEAVAALRAETGALRVLFVAALAAAFAVAFAAPQLLPTAELVGQTSRRDLVAAWESYAPAKPLSWATLREVLVGSGLALVLAPGALAGLAFVGVTARGRRAGYYLAAFVAGQAAPSAGAWLLADLPGYSLMRAADLAWGTFGPFFIAMLTAIGVERALERGRGGRPAAVLLVAAPFLQSAALWLVVRFLMPPLPPIAGPAARFDVRAWVVQQVLTALGMAALGALVVASRHRSSLRTPVAAAYLALFLYGIFHANRFPDGAVPYPTTRSRPELHAELADGLGKYRIFAPYLVLRGEQMLSELPEVTGNEASLHPARVGRLLAEAGLRDYNPDWAAMGAHHRVVDLLGVARVLIDNPAGARAGGFEFVADREYGEAAYRNPTALPRAFVVHRARTAPTSDDAFAAVVAPEFQPGAEAIVEGAAPPLAPSSTAPVVRWVADEPERLDLEVSVGAPALLVVTDGLFPGWRATVDGVPARILLTDYAFRGVPLQAGTHRVVMRYRPASFWGGVLVMLGALVVVLAARGRAPRRVSVAGSDATSGKSA